MNQIQATSIIRQRGQLTIPESIRGKTDWITPGSAVTIARVKEDEIVIKPHSNESKKINWEKLWKQIKRVRSFKGRTKPISISKFIAKDRMSGHSV